MTHDSDTERGGIIQLLRELLEAVAAEDRRHEEGTAALDRTQFGYEFSVGSLSEPDPNTDRLHNATSPSNRPIAVRYEDEDVLVTIDIPEVDPERVSAGVSDDELLLGIDGTIEERIPLRKQHLEISTNTFTNGILEFRLRSTEERQK